MLEDLLEIQNGIMYPNSFTGSAYNNLGHALRPKPPVSPPIAKPTPQKVYYPIHNPSGARSYSPPKPRERTWFDNFLHMLWSVIKVGFLGILGLAGLFKLYDSIGLEGFIVLGIYVGLFGLVGLVCWLIYRSLKWFFQTKVGQFIISMVRVTAYTVLAVLTTFLLWTWATSM